ncbi:MAG: hypothetical protein IPJ65_31610 [Archangiaceae bacterium]|nr:hypothetical protein [Archangiaceae bacterium]
MLRVRGALPELGGAWDLYRFTGVDAAQMQRLIFTGPYPWWTQPDIRASFFRPLSSALIHFDVNVLGDHVPLWHLHSIAWYLALLALVAAFYRRVLPTPLAAAVGLLFFAVDDAHWMPVGWLANRNSLVSAVPALGGLLLHLRWREDGFKPGAWLAPLAYAVGLSGGESALGLLGFVVVYELSGVPDGPLTRRLRALVPLGLVFVGWAVLYRLLGYGARASAIYIDPLTEPLVYLAAAPGRLAALLGSATLNVGSDLWIVMSRGRALLVGAGVLGTVLYALVLRRARPLFSEPQWRRLRWLLCSALLAVLPVLSTFPADRLLLMPSLGFAGVWASVLIALWREKGGLARFARGLLVWTQGLAPLPVWVLGPYFLAFGARYVEQGVNHTTVSDEALAGDVFLVTAPDPTVGMYASLERQLEGHPAPRSWHTTSFAPYDHRLTRVSEDAIEVAVVNGRMLDTVMEQLFRATRFPLNEGFEVTVRGLVFTVLEASEGQPTRVRVRFTLPVSQLTLLQWKGGRLARFELPPVGSTVLLVHEESPLDALRRAVDF